VELIVAHWNVVWVQIMPFIALMKNYAFLFIFSHLFFKTDYCNNFALVKDLLDQSIWILKYKTVHFHEADTHINLVFSAEAAWPSGLGRWIWNLEVPCSNPPPNRYLDLFLVIWSSTPRPRWVNSQLVSLSPVGILNSLCSVYNICLLIYSVPN